VSSTEPVDELSATQFEEHEALEAEHSISGRPFELSAARGGLLGRFHNDKLAFVAVAWLVVIALVALLAPWIAPYGQSEGTLGSADLQPVWSGGSWDHIMGTTPQGYDILSRLIHGARTSLVIGVSVVVLAGLFGVLIGLIAGYKGGRTDRLLMGWVDVQVSFPGLLMALLLLMVLRGSVKTVIIVLAINGWMVYARMTRGVVLSMRERPFVEAAEIIGARPRRVIMTHVLPNLVSPLATLGTLEFARIVLAEAALSFLGLGIQFPQTSWGTDAAQGGAYINRNPWPAIYPGVALTLTVLAVNIVAAWLRVVFDPQEREKRHAATVLGGAGGKQL
jgi:ABC-type dipeptide/oligopeptide/nickel transport system permease subunit